LAEVLKKNSYDRLMHLFDSDKSGRITYKEFVNTIKAIGKNKLILHNDIMKALKHSFDAADKDKNGTIERSEIKKLVRSLKAALAKV
jgi:Ca2+-binding EF-hand superfamily protein